jgi:tetratricopeptide (TPR) repeat protein
MAESPPSVPPQSPPDGSDPLIPADPAEEKAEVSAGADGEAAAPSGDGVGSDETAIQSFSALGTPFSLEPDGAELAIEPDMVEDAPAARPAPPALPAWLRSAALEDVEEPEPEPETAPAEEAASVHEAAPAYEAVPVHEVAPPDEVAPVYQAPPAHEAAPAEEVAPAYEAPPVYEAPPAYEVAIAAAEPEVAAPEGEPTAIVEPAEASVASETVEGPAPELQAVPDSGPLETFAPAEPALEAGSLPVTESIEVAPSGPPAPGAEPAPAPEPIAEPEPVAEPELIAEAAPLPQPELLMEAEPPPEPELLAEPAPLAEPAEVVEPAVLAEPAPLAEAAPAVEPALSPELASSDEVVVSEPIAAEPIVAEPIVAEPVMAVVESTPPVEPEEAAAPEPEPAELTPEPVIEAAPPPEPPAPPPAPAVELPIDEDADLMPAGLSMLRSAARAEERAAAEAAEAEAAAEEGIVDEASFDLVEEVLEVRPAPAPPVSDPLERALDEARLPPDKRIELLLARYDKESAFEDDRPRAAALIHEVGHLTERLRGDEAAAVRTYARALTFDTNLRPNMWAIQRIFRKRGLWSNLIKLLEAEAKLATSSARRCELLVERGTVLEDHLGEEDQAIQAYQEASVAEPAALRPLLNLERIASRRQDRGLLRDAYRRLAAATQSPERRVAYLLDLARAELLPIEAGEEGSLPPQERATRALATARQALAAIEPSAPGLEATLERIHEEMLRAARHLGHAEVAQVLGSWAENLERRVNPETAGDPAQMATVETVIGLRRRQAATLEKQGPEAGPEGASPLDQAWAALQRALAIAPGHPLLLLDATDLLERASRWADLETVLRTRLEAGADPAEQAELHVELGQCLARAGRQSEARAAFEQALQLQPGHLVAEAELERWVVRGGDLDQLARSLLAEGDRQAQGGAAVDAATTLCEAGDLNAGPLGRPDVAEQIYTRALQIQPGLRLAVDGLEDVCRRTGQWARLAELYRAELDRLPAVGTPEASDPANQERTGYLHERLADVGQHRLDDLADAARVLERLRAYRPDDKRVLARLADLYVQLEQRQGEARTAPPAEGEAARPASPLIDKAIVLIDAQVALPGLSEARRIDLGLRAAEALVRAGRIDEAVARYRTLAGSPVATAELLDLLRRERRWRDLCEVLEKDAESSLEGEASVLRLLEAAQVAETELGDLPRAATALSEVLRRSPGHLLALRGLQHLRESAREHEKLAEALEAEVDALENPADQAVALVRLGEVYEDDLSRPDRAEDAYQRVLGTGVPEVELAAARGLQRLAGARGDWARLSESLEAELKSAADPARRAQIEEELAWIAEGPQVDTDGADRRWEAAAGHDPRSLAAARGRARASARRRDVVAHADALEQAARQLGDPDLASALFAQAALGYALGKAEGKATGAFAQALHRIPDLPQALVGQAEMAVGSPLAPGTPPTEFLARADILATRMDATSEERKPELLLELAEQYERAGRLGPAGEALVKLINRQPRHLAGLYALVRVSQGAGDIEVEAGAWERLGRALGSAERSAESWRRAGLLFEDRLHRPADAVRCFGQVLLHLPGDGDAYERQRALLRQKGDWAALVDLFTARLAAIHASDDQVKLLFERADIRQTQLHDSVRAAGDLRRVLELDPSHIEALERLAELEVEMGRVSEALTLFDRLLETEADTPRGQRVLGRSADIAAERLGDQGRALDYLDRLLRVRPDDDSARERAIEVCLRRHDGPAAIAHLEALRQRRQLPRERALIDVRVARVLRDEIKNIPQVQARLEKALEEEPLSIEALAARAALMGSDSAARTSLYRRSLTVARQRLGQGPLDVELHRVMADIAQQAQDREARMWAAAALSCLNQAGPDLEQFLSEQAARIHFRPASKMEPALLEDRLSAWDGEVGVLLRQLWREVAQPLGEALAPALEAAGVARGDRLSSRGSQNLVNEWQRFAGAFGLPEIELYAGSREPVNIRASAALGGILVVGRDVTAPFVAAHRFEAGRAAVLLRDRLVLVHSMTDGEVAQVLAGVIRQVAPTFTGGLDAGALEDRTRLVNKALSRKERKAIGPIVEKLGPLLRGSFVETARQWRRSVARLANRAGLLCAGDLNAAIEGMVPGLPPPATRRFQRPEDVRAKLDGNDEVADLFVFALGPDFTRLRQDLGLVVN